MTTKHVWDVYYGLTKLLVNPLHTNPQKTTIVLRLTIILFLKIVVIEIKTFKPNSIFAY